MPGGRELWAWFLAFLATFLPAYVLLLGPAGAGAAVALAMLMATALSGGAKSKSSRATRPPNRRGPAAGAARTSAPATGIRVYSLE